MRIYFDIENFVNYINSIFTTESGISEEQLMKREYRDLEQAMHQQEIYVCYPGPNEDVNECSSKEFSIVSDDDIKEQDSAIDNMERFFIDLGEAVDAANSEEFKKRFLIRATGADSNIKWHPKFPSKPIKKASIRERFMYCNSACFFNDTSYEQHKEDYYFMGKMNSEIVSLKSLLSIDEVFNPAKTYFTQHIREWEPIRKNCLKCSDIIIVDPYLFDTKVDRFSVNLFKLISVITSKFLYNTNDSKEINVNIFAYIDPDIDILYRRSNSSLEQEIKNNVNASKVNLTIIGANFEKEYKNNKAINRPPKSALREAVHDRYIITNNKLIISGHSFAQYYDISNFQSLNNDVNSEFSARGSMWMSINSFADKNNIEITINALEYLQSKVIDKIVKDGNGIIVGDLKSNIFNFGNKNKCLSFSDYYRYQL